MATYPPEGATRLNLALPVEVREWLQKIAAHHRRSLSAEGCWLVEEAVRRDAQDEEAA